MNQKLLDMAKSLLKAAQENPAQFEELNKAKPGVATTLTSPHPNTQQKGVNQPKMSSSSGAFNPKVANQGVSFGGHFARTKSMKDSAKIVHSRTLNELKAMPKPNLPKTELDKMAPTPATAPAPTKPMGAPKMQIPKPPKPAPMQAPGMQKTEEKSVLDIAKELLKAAQENPGQFEELNKTNSLEMSKPKAMPKPNLPKPKTGMMTKAEIQDELKKEWKPKFKKEGC